MENILEVNGVSKKLGRKEVLKDISITLNKGKVLGILGPNGNGKTTLLNIIVGFLKADSGEVKVSGIEVGSETKKVISFLQEKSNLSKRMNINDAINFYIDFFTDFDMDKMNELIKFMNLDRAVKIQSLSKGMLEKLCLSLVLSRKAQLYILDEPISGVDLLAREKIMDAIINNIDDEKSIIITTHYIGELEQLFDEVVFIGDGKVLEQGNAEDLRIKYEKSIEEIYKKIFAE